MKTLTLLGATGTIGKNTLALVDSAPDQFKVEVMTAHQNADALIALARQYQPSHVAVADPAAAAHVKAALADLPLHVHSGPAGLVAAAEVPTDLTVAGITGIAGLAPTRAALRRGTTVALANKESLVCAGALMMADVAAHKATLLPVDSEHNALFQLYDPAEAADVVQMVLTASGGPFRTWTLEQMAGVIPAQAVAHPNWRMGAKISVDSATLMNKGLELIEATHLFPGVRHTLDAVIHPQSIVHGLITYRDGTTLAALSTPDMRVPLAHALGWPQRLASGAQPLDLTAKPLSFEPADTTRFPCLQLAKDALAVGGSAPIVLNAANEVAVAAFLAGHLPFLAIAALVAETLAAVQPPAPTSIDGVFAIDRLARNWANANRRALAG